MIRNTLALIVVLVVGCLSQAFGQQEGPKPEKRVIHSPKPKPVQTQEQTNVPTETNVFYFPEFYYFWPIEKNDTTLRYECYDAHNELINVDTLHNINIVQHIYFIKSFRNYMHTYIDGDGKPSPSIVSKTLYRYDRLDNDLWKSTDLNNNYTFELKEFKKEIIRMDTTLVTDPITGIHQQSIRKYYKVQEQTQNNDAGKLEK